MHGKTPNIDESEVAIQSQGGDVAGIDCDFDRASSRTLRQSESVAQDGTSHSASAGLGRDPQIGHFPQVAVGMLGQQQDSDFLALSAVEPPGSGSKPSR